MPYNLYLLITFASAIALTVLGCILLGINIPYIDGSKKVRSARAILAGAYFVLALSGYLKLFDTSEVDRLFLGSITISVAAYQALLITATIVALIQPQDINIKRIFISTATVTAAVVLFFILVILYRSVFILYIGAFLSILLYLCCTYIFKNEYNKCKRLLEDYYDEEQNYRLHWAKTSFYSSLAVGMFALVPPFTSMIFYDIFTVSYILFYLMFTIRFNSYISQLKYYLPAILSRERDLQQDRESSIMVCSDNGLLDRQMSDIESDCDERMDALAVSLQGWVDNEMYLCADKSIEEVAAELNTDISFLRWYFRTKMDKDFRTYRVELRIEYAKRILSENPGISLNAISLKAGFNTKANFYTYFKKYVGMSPAEYLSNLKK